MVPGKTPNKIQPEPKKYPKTILNFFFYKGKTWWPNVFLNWETRSVGLTSHHGACRGYPKAWEPGFGIVSKMGRPPIFFSGFIIMMYHIFHYNSVVFLNDLGLSTRPIYVFDVHAKFRIEWWNAISVKTTSFLETRRQWLFKRTHVLYFLVNFLGNNAWKDAWQKLRTT